MKYPASAFVVCPLLLMTGCSDLLSVHPLATPATIVFDAGLTGLWSCENKDCKGTALIRRSEESENSYDIVWIPEEAGEEPLRLKGQLAKTGSRLVFDLVYVKTPNLAIPGHFFMLVEKTAAGVTFHRLDSEWLRGKVIDPKGPAHAMVDGKPVLTAESARINAFLVEFGLDSKAVSGSMIFKRLKQN